MSEVEKYRKLARRDNTVKSYADAVRHFEVEWNGSLPASADTVAKYLADLAPMYATATLRARLAGLAHWHVNHGFVDPTKAAIVREVFRGIRRAHAAPLRQAKPIELEQLESVNAWIEAKLSEAPVGSTEGIRLARDRAILLLGFWRGFRSDELSRLRLENVKIEPGKGMTCFFPTSKGDRDSMGQTFQCPALTRLCPVEAFEYWLAESGLKSGPAFRAISQWGHISDKGLASTSLIPWLRNLLEAAGIDASNEFSSHSLRRGFANWARSSGWDIKDLMTFVGWRDMHSALRYMDTSASDFQEKLEEGLSRTASDAPRPARRARPKVAKSNVIPLHGQR